MITATKSVNRVDSFIRKLNVTHYYYDYYHLYEINSISTITGYTSAHLVYVEIVPAIVFEIGVFRLISMRCHDNLINIDNL